jgi:hypothetical protein
VAELKTGKSMIKASSSQDPYTMAGMALELGAKALKGEKIEKPVVPPANQERAYFLGPSRFAGWALFLFQWPRALRPRATRSRRHAAGRTKCAKTGRVLTDR